MINKALKECLDDYASAYIDDVLVFSDNLEDHIQHVRKVITLLQDNGLPIDVDKCEFHVQETKYLGLIITTEGIKMDRSKVSAVLDWETPRTLKDVQSFLGFANFYRQFILRYSKVAAPLTNMTRGLAGATTTDTANVPKPQFNWTSECQESFDALKKAFTEDPILGHYESGRQTMLETDASDNVIAGVLSQKHELSNGKSVWKPIGYFSKKMIPAERNYDIHDKELLAIVRAFEEYRSELLPFEGDDSVLVVSDHKNLEYFMTTKRLNSRQARWSELLSGFNFVITYRPGKQNPRADALTRRTQDMPDGDVLEHRDVVMLPSERLCHPPQDIQDALILRPDPIVAVNATTTRAEATKKLVALPLAGPSAAKSILRADVLAFQPTTVPALQPTTAPRVLPVAPIADQDSLNKEADNLVCDHLTDIDRAVGEDATYTRVRASVSKGDTSTVDPALQRAKVHPADCWVTEKGRVMMEHRLWVPDNEPLRQRIIRSCHDPPACGHPGIATTLELVRRSYFWPRMTKDIRRFVRNCRRCRTTKSLRIKKEGLLHPMPVAEAPWSEIAVDFVVELPKSTSHEGVAYTNILTVTDRFTKEKHLIPVGSMTAQNTARLFVKYVFSRHGLPRAITSDRGSQFVSDFWRFVCTTLGVDQRLSSAYHPETDGQSERSNQDMEQYLRSYVNYSQDDWVDWLPLAEFALNNHVSASTGVSPFYANTGRNPAAMPHELQPGNLVVRSKGAKKLEEGAAKRFALQMSDLHAKLRNQLLLTQYTQADSANLLRKPHPNYQLGDMVYVSTKNFRTTRPSRKLDYRFLGPYKITKVIDNITYKLDLPADIQAHNAFHASLLQPTGTETPLEGQLVEPPPAVQVERDGEVHEEWEVEEIVDCRKRMQKGRIAAGTVRPSWLEYKVR